MILKHLIFIGAILLIAQPFNSAMAKDTLDTDSLIEGGFTAMEKQMKEVVVDEMMEGAVDPLEHVTGKDIDRDGKIADQAKSKFMANYKKPNIKIDPVTKKQTLKKLDKNLRSIWKKQLASNKGMKEKAVDGTKETVKSVIKIIREEGCDNMKRNEKVYLKKLEDAIHKGSKYVLTAVTAYVNPALAADAAAVDKMVGKASKLSYFKLHSKKNAADAEKKSKSVVSIFSKRLAKIILKKATSTICVKSSRGDSVWAQ